MRNIVVVLFILIAVAKASAASDVQLGVLPAVSTRAALPLELLRLDLDLFLGSESFKIGPYIGAEALFSQQVDTVYGGGVRAGRSFYVELDAGYFHRSISQVGMASSTGDGFAGNFVFGWQVGKHAGAALSCTAKRITSGSLDSRTIIDVLPLFTTRLDL